MRLLKALLVGVLLLAMLGLALVYSGVYSVAADEPHYSAVRWLLQATRERSIAVRLDEVTVPENLDQVARISRGGELYGLLCQVCHLGPGIEPTALSQGLTPEPPRLTEHAGHHGLKEQFWIVKHGIKMTGMPAWGETQTDEQMWDIVAFVSRMPNMTPEAFQEYTSASNK